MQETETTPDKRGLTSAGVVVTYTVLAGRDGHTDEALDGYHKILGQHASSTSRRALCIGNDNERAAVMQETTLKAMRQSMNAAVASSEACAQLAVEHHSAGIVDHDVLARWQTVVTEIDALRNICLDAQVVAAAGEWLESITSECAAPHPAAAAALRR